MALIQSEGVVGENAVQLSFPAVLSFLGDLHSTPHTPLCL